MPGSQEKGPRGIEIVDRITHLLRNEGQLVMGFPDSVDHVSIRLALRHDGVGHRRRSPGLILEDELSSQVPFQKRHDCLMAVSSPPPGLVETMIVTGFSG